MVKKDAPERDAAANIDAQVPATPFQLQQRAHQWLRGCREQLGFKLQMPTAQHPGIAFDLRQRPAKVRVRRGPTAMLVEVDRDAIASAPENRTDQSN